MGRPDPALLDLTRYPFRHVITTRFADIDPNRHINNVAMAAAFEDARARFDVAQGHLETMGHMRTMIAANHIDYVGEAHYPAPLDMYVGVLDLGRSSWSIPLAIPNATNWSTAPYAVWYPTSGPAGNRSCRLKWFRPT